MKPVHTQLLFSLLAVTSCAAPAAAPQVEVSTWGTMREVLRDGNSEGRIALSGLTNGIESIGVGAMADLSGEVTIVNGRVLVAECADPSSDSAEASTPSIRDAAEGDSASLLVVAEVTDWEEVPIGGCADYAALEASIAAQLRQSGADLDKPLPVRVRIDGRVRHLELHVIAGACPIAEPLGPSPWRFSGAAEDVELVGFYAENSAGKLTHHNRRSHLHAVTKGLMGHLDDVAFDAAVLLLPSAR